MKNAPDSLQARLQAIYEFSARLSITLDLEKVYALVMDAMLTLTEAERGVIVLVSPAEGRLTVAAERGVAAVESSQTGISMSVVERTVRTERPILTDNAQEDSRFAALQSVVGYQLRSIMCAPLQVRGRTFGAVYVDNRYHAGAFDADDLSLLVVFANQAAMAIDNVRVFRQTDRLLSRRVEELSLFQRIDRELSDSLDLDRVMGHALRWAVRLTQAEAGALGLVADDDGESAPALQLLVRSPDWPEAPPLAESMQPLLQTLAARRTERAQNVASILANARRLVTRLVVPVARDDNVVGLIVLESGAADAFDRDDVAFVERLADRAAVALENSGLYAALARSKQAQADFVRLVTHELRTPMTSIVGYLDLLDGHVRPLKDADRAEFIAIIQRNVTQMSALLDDLVALQEVESDAFALTRETFPLQVAVSEAIETLQGAVAAKSQELDVDMPAEPLLVFADRTRVRQIVANLISNANKYTLPEGQLGVRVRASADSAIVTVMDSGIGIQPADQARLFSRFFRADDARVQSQTGFGLGLFIVKQLVEAQGGTITYHSVPDQGTAFTITLPRA